MDKSKLVSQEDRLKEIYESNHFNYKMKDVYLVFTMAVDGYLQQSKTVKAIKEKITEGEFNSLINGITSTFLMSLHAYKLPLDEALKLGMTQGIFGIQVATLKKKKEGKKK